MRLTKQQFIDRFTPEEMVGILTAARQNVAVEAWLFRFNNLTPDSDGTSVDTEDLRTISGLNDMEAAGLIAAGRAAEILGTVAPAAMGDFSVGDIVRVLPPFDAFMVGIYQIEGFGIDCVLIDGGKSFAADYVEKI